MAIGEIRIDLRAMVAKFLRDLDRANKSLQGFERRTAAVAKGLSAFIGVTAGFGLAAITRSSLEFADNIGKLADRLSISTDALQKYHFAATQAGIRTQTFDMALQRFIRRTQEAVAGNKELRSAFAALGLSMRDIETLGLERAFEEVIRRLDQMRRSTKGLGDAQRVAQKLFDSEGVTLLQLTESMDASIKKAEELGIVISRDQIDAAERATTAMDTLATVIAANFAPVVIASIQLTSGLAQGLKELAQAAGRMAGTLPHTADSAARAAERTNQLIEQTRRNILKLQEQASRKEVLPGEIILIGPEITQAIDKEREKLRRLMDEYVRLTNLAASLRQESEKTRSEGIKGFGKLQDPRQLARQLELEKKGAQVYSETRSEIEKLNIRFAELDELLSAKKITFDTYARAVFEATAKVEELGKELDKALLPGREPPDLSEAALTAEGRQVFQATRTEMERLNMEFERLDQLLAAEKITFDTYSRAVFDATEKIEEMEDQMVDVDRLARDMGNTFTSAFEDAVIEGEDLRDVLQGLVDDIQRIILRTTVTAPLQEFLGGFFAGIFGRGTTAQAAQHGGPVRAGKPYLVGEKGPEVFVGADTKSLEPQMFKDLAEFDTSLGILPRRQAIKVPAGKLIGTEGPELFMPETSGEIKPDPDRALAETRQSLLKQLVQTEEQRSGRLRQIVDRAREAVAKFSPFEGLQARAFGGPVFAGSSYLVGEHGPEVFVPQMSGRIEPGVGTNTYNIDARGADIGVERRIVQAIRMAEERAVNRSVRAVEDLRARR